MFCKYCGSKLDDAAQFCKSCGQATGGSTPSAATNVLPPENRPLSPWAYFGLQLLFAIPVIGFIMLIVFSFSGSNINRRNFARSYWCVYLLAAIAVGIMAGSGILASFF